MTQPAAADHLCLVLLLVQFIGEAFDFGRLVKYFLRVQRIDRCRGVLQVFRQDLAVMLSQKRRISRMADGVSENFSGLPNIRTGPRKG